MSDLNIVIVVVITAIVTSVVSVENMLFKLIVVFLLYTPATSQDQACFNSFFVEHNEKRIVSTFATWRQKECQEGRRFTVYH